MTDMMDLAMTITMWLFIPLMLTAIVSGILLSVLIFGDLFKKEQKK